MAGEEIIRYLKFPPLTQYIEHAGYSWIVFSAMGLFIAAVISPIAARVISSHAESENGQTKPFPLWGWGSLALCIISWIMAWTRFEWFTDYQIFTFSPLWLSYIGIVNALTFSRSGKCMLTSRPGHLIRLFIASAVFWWYFEYLNRFVQNWYYIGIEGLTPFQYVIFATLPFSTVLPAVLSTCELLETFPRLRSGLKNYRKIDVKHPKPAAGAILIIAAAGLYAIGIYPDYLYPLLWLCPLFILTSLQSLSGKKTLFSPLSHGDWQRITLLAVSALICGFFWEMWNSCSYAKWQYSIPFVQRYHLFEMPVLGYAGYLPFGLECGVIADFCSEQQESPAKEMQ